MTRREFNEAVAVAESDADLSAVDDTVLDGCGLPGFEPVHVTLRAVAKFIRWQAMMLNGEWDATALANCMAIGRKRFLIV